MRVSSSLQLSTESEVRSVLWGIVIPFMVSLSLFVGDETVWSCQKRTASNWLERSFRPKWPISEGYYLRTSRSHKRFFSMWIYLFKRVIVSGKLMVFARNRKICTDAAHAPYAWTKQIRFPCLCWQGVARLHDIRQRTGYLLFLQG